MEANQLFIHHPDFVRRDRILGIDSRIWEEDISGVERFQEVSLPELEKLFEEKFINPQGRQNFSLTAEEFLAFMRKYPAVVAHGYAVSPYRDDYRVTIEGLYVHLEDVTLDLQRDFEELCEGADELELGSHLYSWWD